MIGVKGTTVVKRSENSVVGYFEKRDRYLLESRLPQNRTPPILV